MAEEHNYKLVGTGKTTRAADRDLRSKTKELVQKLKKGGADVPLNILNIIRTEYKGLYIQKQGTIVEGPSSFAMESEEGWTDVRNRALSTANLRKYSVGYTVDQYLNLTQIQLAATTKPRIPAGPYSRSASSLDALANW